MAFEAFASELFIYIYIYIYIIIIIIIISLLFILPKKVKRYRNYIIFHTNWWM